MVLLTEVEQHDINAVVGQALADSADNTSAVLVINMSEAPCEIDFMGNPPSNVNVVVANDGVTATATVETTTEGVMMTLTFSQPIGTDGIDFDAVFEYASK